MKKLVKESLNEIISFERESNPLSNLGVGQSHLIKTWLDEMNITNYKLNSDLSIDVKDSVNLSSKNLGKIPNYIKFNEVDGDFDCSENNLTSLEGCPISVDGYFSCSYNNLTSLENCPTSVGGNFYCSYNNLTSLEGCPTSVGGNFYCHYNNLTSLKGCPTSIGGGFSCSNNQVKFTEEDVIKLCDVKGDIYV